MLNPKILNFSSSFFADGAERCVIFGQLDTLICSREGDHSIGTDFTLAQASIAIFLMAGAEVVGCRNCSRLDKFRHPLMLTSVNNGKMVLALLILLLSTVAVGNSENDMASGPSQPRNQLGRYSPG